MKRLAYRYIPGSLKTGCTMDNGSVNTEEFRLTKSRDKRLTELQANPNVQWAKVLPDG